MRAALQQELQITGLMSLNRAEKLLSSDVAVKACCVTLCCGSLASRTGISLVKFGGLC